MMTTNITAPVSSEDSELVRASLAGDREAFGQLVSRYQSLVCSLAYSATGSLPQSEDLAQETFIAAWKNLSALREPEKIRSWLCGIARNLINASFRAQGHEPSHHAESLDEVPESTSPEPLPVDRAISTEEAQILWRALERIPESYREPLVLFYREHQSVETVAQSLELTEEAVKQRLSRGRKLLQEEVLAFVEGALERTGPGPTFTVAVVAALPLAVTTAKAATVGAAAVKGGAGAKGILSLGALTGLLPMVGAIAFSWKTSVDDSKSPRERKFMVRMAVYQVAFFVVALAVCFGWLPFASHQPWHFAAILGVVILATIINGSVTNLYVVRKRLQIRVEEGTLTETPPDDEESTKRGAFRKALRLTVPFLIMLAGAAVSLPWREHGWRCAVIIFGNVAVILWFLRKTYRQLSFQEQPRFKAGRTWLSNPFMRVPLVLFGTALMGGALGYVLPYFLNPGAAKAGIPRPEWLGPLGWCLLASFVVFGVLAFVFRKSLQGWNWLAEKLPVQFLHAFGPDAVAEATYAPLFQQLDLRSEQRARLKELVLQRTMVGVRMGMSLMNWKLDASKRADLSRDAKTETDKFNGQISEFLGAEHYSAFRQFEKTIPERTMLDELRKRHAKGAAALSIEQQTQLLDRLAQARSQYLWTTELSRRNQEAGTGYVSLFTDENLNAFAGEEEQFARQFLAQARQILNSEQLALFAEAQERQRKSQIAQFKLATKLFASKGR